VIRTLSGGPSTQQAKTSKLKSSYPAAPATVYSDASHVWGGIASIFKNPYVLVPSGKPVSTTSAPNPKTSSGNRTVVGTGSSKVSAPSGISSAQMTQLEKYLAGIDTTNTSNMQKYLASLQSANNTSTQKYLASLAKSNASATSNMQKYMASLAKSNASANKSIQSSFAGLSSQMSGLGFPAPTPSTAKAAPPSTNPYIYIAIIGAVIIIIGVIAWALMR